MIYFITKWDNTYGIISYKFSWGKKIKKKIKIISYEKLIHKKSLSPGIYIFANYDLLNEDQAQAINIILKEFKKIPEKFIPLNDPLNSLKRLDLLNLLYTQNINSFRIFNAKTQLKDINFPVFIRKGFSHEGKISHLLKNHKELNKYINTTKKEGFNENEILITEFVDTSDEFGIYRKYSSFILGDKVIPRHIFFSKEWMIKSAKIVTTEFINEETNFIFNNPHEHQLKEIFKLAKIQYGRIDYSFKNNKMVIWEINPNPMIASSSSLKKSSRAKNHKLFVEKFNSEIKMLDDNTIFGESIENPLKKILGKKYLEKIFPNSNFNNLRINIYFQIKTIILFNFYKIRNSIFY